LREAARNKKGAVSRALLVLNGRFGSDKANPIDQHKPAVAIVPIQDKHRAKSGATSLREAQRRSNPFFLCAVAMDCFANARNDEQKADALVAV
jgi:hypothetical protein